MLLGLTQNFSSSLSLNIVAVANKEYYLSSCQDKTEEGYDYSCCRWMIILPQYQSWQHSFLRFFFQQAKVLNVNSGMSNKHIKAFSSSGQVVRFNVYPFGFSAELHDLN